MALFQAFNISASGMTAERFRTDIIAENIANVNTTSTESGGPYRRKIVNFAERKVTPFSQYYATASQNPAIGNGVKVTSVKEDTETDFVKEYDPSNPDADADGYVSYPNVNTVTEMTNLIDAQRAYEVGLVNYVVPREQVMDKAMELAEIIAANAPISLKLSKEIFHVATQCSFEDAQRYCNRCWDYIEKTEDAVEGPKAFLEKRKPDWKGR